MEAITADFLLLSIAALLVVHRKICRTHFTGILRTNLKLTVILSTRISMRGDNFTL